VCCGKVRSLTFPFSFGATIQQEKKAMRYFAAVSFILLVSLLATNALAQNAPPDGGAPPYGDYKTHLPGLPEDRNPYRQVRYQRAPRFGPRQESRLITKGPLAPALRDRTSYASFLSQPQTGLVRLLSRFDQSKSGKPPKINGGGAYYSFFYRSHEYGFGSDLELSSTTNFEGGTQLPRTYNFSVGFAGADYGMLTNLGDLPLESLTAADPRVEFMLKHEPPRREPDARCEYRRFQKGVTINGQLFRSTLPIEVGSTYVLRSIVYRSSDVLIGFHVVRQDDDHSVTIAWKLLKEFPAKKLENVLYVNDLDKCPTR
jgi:hypothetical protein